MENRRRDYRHAFAPHERRPAHITVSAATVPAEMINLSLSGMRVRLAGPEALPPPHARVRVSIQVKAEQAVTLDAEVVHRQSEPDACCGLRFLSLVDLAAQDARQRKLWHFLLNEQRRQRQTQTS